MYPVKGYLFWSSGFNSEQLFLVKAAKGITFQLDRPQSDSESNFLLLNIDEIANREFDGFES